MDFYRQTFAEINLEALKFNILQLKRDFDGSQFFCPMVKANAYGHGDQTLSLYLEFLNLSSLGVCLIEEALILREAGCKKQILVFRGFDEIGAKEIIGQNLTPVVSTLNQLELLARLAKKPIEMHLKFNTGMNRLGFEASQMDTVKSILDQHKGLKVAGVLTHLASGEDGLSDDGQTVQQLQKFMKIEQCFKEFKPVFHVFNSAGMMAKLLRERGDLVIPEFSNNWGARPGLSMYGVAPTGIASPWKLQPVMTLRSTVGSIRNLAVGEKVSYGGSWTATRPSTIGVVPIGYADGYPRSLSNRGQVLVLGERAPVIGKVCMDFLMIDLTDILKIKSFRNVKDFEVVLFGADDSGNFISVDEVASWANTISWEILTQVGVRVPRKYLGGGEFFKQYGGSQK